jgi:hypothetical protein
MIYQPYDSQIYSLIYSSFHFLNCVLENANVLYFGDV